MGLQKTAGGFLFWVPLILEWVKNPYPLGTPTVILFEGLPVRGTFSSPAPPSYGRWPWPHLQLGNPGRWCSRRHPEVPRGVRLISVAFLWSLSRSYFPPRKTEGNTIHNIFASQEAWSFYGTCGHDASQIGSGRSRTMLLCSCFCQLLPLDPRTL